VTARNLAAAIVLAIAAAFALLSAIGILRSRNSFAALHPLGLAGITVPPLALAAVVIAAGFGVSAVKGLAVVVVLLLGGPIGSHAIGIAHRRRRRS